MPLFKVWSEDKLNKKFVVAEYFAELVSKGNRFCLHSFISFVYFSAWHDRIPHATSDLADYKCSYQARSQDFLRVGAIS